MVYSWHGCFSLMIGTTWDMGKGDGQIKYCSMCYSFKIVVFLRTVVFLWTLQQYLLQCFFVDNTVYSILQHYIVSTTHDRGILQCVYSIRQCTTVK